MSAAGIGQRPPLRRNGQAADTRYGSGLISRRLVVRTFSHLNGDRRRTRRLLGHRHGIAGHGHLSHTRRTGRRGDCAVTGTGHCESRGRGIVVNSRSRLVNVQRPSRLFNLPGYAQCICGTVDPAIAIFRLERRGIGLCVRTRRLAAHDQFGGIVAIPNRGLLIAGIGQQTTLQRIAHSVFGDFAAAAVSRASISARNG